MRWGWALMKNPVNIFSGRMSTLRKFTESDTFQDKGKTHSDMTHRRLERVQGKEVQIEHVRPNKTDLMLVFTFCRIRSTSMYLLNN